MLKCAMLGAFTVMCGKCFLCVFLGHSQPLSGGGGRGGGYPLVSGTETILSQGSRGSPTFSRGEGGPNANFYRPYNL